MVTENRIINVCHITAPHSPTMASIETALARRGLSGQKVRGKIQSIGLFFSLGFLLTCLPVAGTDMMCSYGAAYTTCGGCILSIFLFFPFPFVPFFPWDRGFKWIYLQIFICLYLLYLFDLLISCTQSDERLKPWRSGCERVVKLYEQSDCYQFLNFMYGTFTLPTQCKMFCNKMMIF